MEQDRDGKLQPENSDSLLREHKLLCRAVKKERGKQSSLATLVVVKKKNQCECKQSNKSIPKCEVRIVVLNTIFNNTSLTMHDVLKADQSTSTLLQVKAQS